MAEVIQVRFDGQWGSQVESLVLRPHVWQGTVPRELRAIRKEPPELGQGHRK